MRKFLLVLLLTGTTSLAFAQKFKVQSAIIHYRNGELKEAMTVIDEAVQSSSTAQDPKAWYWRGTVYWDLYGKDTLRKVHPDPLPLAVESFAKCLEFDKKDDFKEDPENAERMLMYAKAYQVQEYYNKGISKYNKGDYAGALADFEVLVASNPSDSTIFLNAGVFAEKAGQKSKALKYYQMALDRKLQKPQIFISMANIQKSEKDTAGALATLAKGRQVFPAEKALVVEEVNIYLSSNKSDKALEMLSKAIELDPKNSSLYFAKGKCYDDMKDRANAEIFYKKSFEVDPAYFDGYYNLGIMYFNDGAEITNAANKVPAKDVKKYNELKKKAQDAFKTAQPHLEKALEIQPNDGNTLLALQQLYANINMLEKSGEMKKRREALRK